MTVEDDKWIGLGSSAGRIEFDDQTTDEVNILDANVGIKTDTPSAELEVNGTIKALGNSTITFNDATAKIKGFTTYLTLEDGYIVVGDTTTNDITDGDGDLLVEDELEVNGNARFDGLVSAGVDADTIADTGDANPATHTLTPTSSYVELTCNDADTCDITMGESGIPEGAKVTIVNVSANVCDFSDTAGVSELAGAFAMGQYDALELVYIGDRWAEVSRSNN